MLPLDARKNPHSPLLLPVTSCENHSADFLSDLLLDPGGFLGPHHDGPRDIAFQFSDTVGPTASYFRGSITRPAYLLSTLYVVGHPTPHKTRFPSAG